MIFLDKFLSSDYQKLINNVFFSGIFQVATFLSPIITTPYLVKVIGIEKFGLVSFVTVFFTYLYSITDYGFTITANREVALNRESKESLAKIFADVIFAKLLLSLIVLIILLFFVLFINKFSSNSTIFLLGFSLVIGRILIPNWFFQGLEQMKLLAILNFFAQLLFISLIFFTIKQEEDYKYVVLLQGISYVIVGLTGTYIVTYKILRGVKIYFYFIGAINQIKSSFLVFISSISIISYNNANLLILGFFVNNEIVGYYSIADKVINLIRQGIGSISTAMFPYICRLTQQNHKAVYDFFRGFYTSFILATLILSISIAIFAKKITYLFTATFNPKLEHIIIWMSLIPIIVILSNPPYITLLAYNHKTKTSQVMIFGGILNVFLNLVLVPFFNIYGTIFTVYITEIFITSTLFYFLEKIYPEISLLKN